MEILTAPYHDHWLLMTLSLAETQLGRGIMVFTLTVTVSFDNHGSMSCNMCATSPPLILSQVNWFCKYGDGNTWSYGSGDINDQDFSSN